MDGYSDESDHEMAYWTIAKPTLVRHITQHKMLLNNWHSVLRRYWYNIHTNLKMARFSNLAILHDAAQYRVCVVDIQVDRAKTIYERYSPSNNTAGNIFEINLR